MTAAERRSGDVAPPDRTLIATPRDGADGAGGSLYELGLTLFHDGRNDEAVGVFTEIVRTHGPTAMEVPADNPCPWFAVSAMGHLMLVAQIADDELRGVTRMLTPLATCAELGRTDPHHRSMVLTVLGLARLQLGRTAGAAEVLEQALQETLAAHRPRRAQLDVTATATLGLATARDRAGVPAPEAEHAADLLRLLGRRDARTYDPFLVDALVIAARDARRRGDLTRALNRSNEAVGTAGACHVLDASGREDCSASALLVLADVLTDLGRFAEAARAEQRAAAAAAEWRAMR